MSRTHHLFIQPQPARRAWWILSLWVAMLGLAGQSAENNTSDPSGHLFVQAWQTEDGLPENLVVSVAQTPDQYLWVATHLGLFRFDGVKFQELGFVSDAGISTGIIRAMLRDHSGRLWLAKDRGALVCLDRGQVTQTFTSTNGLSTFQTRSMAEDHEGNIWLSDSQGSVFCIQQGKVRQYGPEQGLQLGTTCWLASDLNGQIWFSQGQQVGVFSKGQFTARFPINTSAAHMASARRGGVWICDGQQIQRADQGEALEAFGGKLPIHTGLEITALHEDQEHRLWVGTLSHGLFYWDGNKWRTAPISHSSVQGISEDSEGNIWVGTQGGGLNRVRSRTLELLGPREGLPFSTVQSVCESATGDIWAVGQSGVLGRQINEGWSSVTSASGWRWGQATCVAAAPDGTVYVGTRKDGVVRYREGQFTRLEVTNLPGSSYIRLLTVSSNGDLWIGPDSGASLFRIRNGMVQSFGLPPYAHLRAITVAHNGDTWVATAEGQLFRTQEDRLEDETQKTLVTPYPIRTLHTMDDGTIWIGYAGRGVGRLKNGEFLLTRESDGLLDEYVSQIVSDDNGRLWLAGNRGIYYVTLADFEARAEGNLKRVRSVAIGRGEGLPNLQASFDFWPNATRSRTGDLLMTMLSGLVVVNRADTQKVMQQPSVALEEVMVNGQIVAAHDHIGIGSETTVPAPTNLRELRRLPDLGPGVQQMDIQYTAFSFANPESLEFRYQLKGRDADWVQAANQRVAHFGTLAPGEYSFTVQARTYDSDWNEATAPLSFQVRPYLWQTWWFKSGSIVALLALVGGIIRYVERKQTRLRIERLEREHAVERERARIAKDIHDELGSQLTSITILSDLAQSADAPQQEILSDMKKIGEVSRGLTRTLSDIVWAVNPRNDNLESFITYACHFAEEFLRPAGVRCFLEIPEKLPVTELTTEIRHNLFMVMKEAVNNVVKHAQASQVRIRVALKPARLELSIEDNGCGFDLPSSARTGDESAQPNYYSTGNGLANMRYRIEHLGGDFRLRSTHGAGTRIEVSLPLGHRS